MELLPGRALGMTAIEGRKHQAEEVGPIGIDARDLDGGDDESEGDDNGPVGRSDDRPPNPDGGNATVVPVQHPVLQVPCWGVHPCRTRAVTEILTAAGGGAPDPGMALRSWLSVVAPYVGLARGAFE